MAVGLAVAVIVIVVVLVLISRMQTRTRNEAVADLARERDALEVPGILDLVNEEIADSGIGKLPGAENVGPTVLLRVWRRDGAGCAEGQGFFVIADGIEPGNATEDTLRFECGDDPS
jgi:hypothetical protein